MKKTIGQYEFTEAFRKIRPENFSYDGLKALYEYFDNYEESTGEEIELDVIAICCDYTEYENLEEFQQSYDADEYQTIEDIENATTVIKVDDDRFIIQQF